MEHIARGRPISALCLPTRAGSGATAPPPFASIFLIADQAGGALQPALLFQPSKLSPPVHPAMKITAELRQPLFQNKIKEKRTHHAMKVPYSVLKIIYKQNSPPFTTGVKTFLLWCNCKWWLIVVGHIKNISIKYLHFKMHWCALWSFVYYLRSLSTTL